MAFIENHAEKGTYVSLIADYPADQLYKKFGFQSTEPKSVECLKILKKKMRLN